MAELPAPPGDDAAPRAADHGPSGVEHGTEQAGVEQAGVGPAVMAIDFWHDDSLWQVIWPAALAVAVVVHGVFFMAASTSPAKRAPERIAMAISMPPPPPEPPPPEPPRKERRVDSEKAPAPSAPTPTETPPTETPPPLSTAEPVNLGPSTGQGVAVAVGTPDGEAGAPPVTGQGPPPETNRAQAGPPQAAWDPNGYKSSAFDVMNRAKRYPRKATVLGLEGKCMVKVAINHDGSLAARPSIVGKGTGHDILDDECIAMAERSKFAPIPAHVEAPMIFRIPIEFHLENR